MNVLFENNLIPKDKRLILTALSQLGPLALTYLLKGPLLNKDSLAPIVETKHETTVCIFEGIFFLGITLQALELCRSGQKRHRTSKELRTSKF